MKGDRSSQGQSRGTQHDEATETWFIHGKVPKKMGLTVDPHALRGRGESTWKFDSLSLRLLRLPLYQRVGRVSIECFGGFHNCFR
jgi:hypothetical protein